MHNNTAKSFDSLVDDQTDTGQSQSTLISRNVTVKNRRTSIRLEPEMWRSLKDIAAREECSIHDICTLVCLRKKENTSLTAAIRVFVMLYYKAATTEEGHRRAGHGDFENMKRRARITGTLLNFFSKKRRVRPNNYNSLDINMMSATAGQ